MDIIYSFNMPLFFFVSGFLAFKERKSIHYYINNVWKKTSMLLIPTVAFSLLWALAQMKEVDFSNGFGKYWFGCALLECFIIYYLVCIVTKTEKQQLFLMMFFSSLGIVYLSTGVGDKYLAVIELNHLTKYLHFFTLGIFAKYFYNDYIKILNNEILRTIGIIFFLLLIFLLRYEGMLPFLIERFMCDILIRYLGLFVIVMFLYDISQQFNSNSIAVKGIKIIAKNSFGIYLLQYFFLPDFRGHEWLMNIDTFTMFIVCVIYSVICTIVCLCIISLLSRSRFLCRFLLGKR